MTKLNNLVFLLHIYRTNTSDLFRGTLNLLRRNIKKPFQTLNFHKSLPRDTDQFRFSFLGAHRLFLAVKTRCKSKYSAAEITRNLLMGPINIYRSNFKLHLETRCFRRFPEKYLHGFLTSGRDKNSCRFKCR